MANTSFIFYHNLVSFGKASKLDLSDKNYPGLLKEIQTPPKRLYYFGELPAASETLIAIVGTRKATYEGKILAKQIAKDLAQNGICVVSGLALGIDTAAHEGALSGNGKTIAVLGNGLNQIYPRSNENLAKEIIKKGGTIFSEYEPDSPAYPNQFLERNRLISGLSLATVIIEAPIHSGALVTAKNAVEQGREVFVAPGPARHKNYEGSHLLLRNGARLVTSVGEILEDLNLEKRKTEFILEKNGIDSESKQIIEILKTNDDGLTVDKIIELTKLETRVVNERLTLLAFEEIIEEGNAGFKLKG